MIIIFITKVSDIMTRKPLNTVGFVFIKNNYFLNLIKKPPKTNLITLKNRQLFKVLLTFMKKILFESWIDKHKTIKMIGEDKLEQRNYTTCMKYSFY